MSEIFSLIAGACITDALLNSCPGSVTRLPACNCGWQHGIPDMSADVPVPVATPRRLTVPAVVLVVVVVLSFVWGLAMFLVGQRSVEITVTNPNDAAVLAVSGLLRVDQVIAQGDFVTAREELARLQIPGTRLSQTLVALRTDYMQKIEAERAAVSAAEQIAKTPAAIAARLAAHLWQINVPGLAWQDPLLLPPTSATSAVTAEKTVILVLPSERFGAEVFIPLARITHPHVAQRVYVLHPTKGLLRSDDAGVTWRTGVAALQNLSGTKLAFTSGDDPGLVIIGETMWLFADRDAAYFMVPTE